MKNVNKVLLGVLAISSLLLGACSKTPEPEEAINPSETISVSAFLNDPALMEKTNTWCMESPGERGELPNCINAGVAAMKLRRCKEFKKAVCK